MGETNNRDATRFLRKDDGAWKFRHPGRKIRGPLGPKIEASRGEATVIFYMAVIVSLIFLILVNYYTGFLSEIYHFFDDAFFDGQYTRRPPRGLP